MYIATCVPFRKIHAAKTNSYCCIVSSQCNSVGTEGPNQKIGRGGGGGGEKSERLIGGRKGIRRIFDSLVAILVIDVFDSAVE